MKRLLVIPLLAVAAVTLGACSSPTTGSPTANPTTGQSDGGGDTSTSSSGGGGGNQDPLASVNPCSLLTTAQLNQYQLTQSQSGTEDSARTCSWRGSIGPSQNGGEVDTNIYDNAGLSQINSSGFSVTSYPVGKHQGRLVQSSNGGGLCAVSIGVTDSSRVDITGEAGTGNVSDSCGIAEQFAKLVEQNLVALGD